MSNPDLSPAEVIPQATSELKGLVRPWVLCSEEMPPRCQDVIGWRPDWFYGHECTWDGETWAFNEYEGIRASEQPMIYWMPLPEGPA